MITELAIKNFKVHKDQKLNFKGLNILTGQNGMGKSSIIQVILLLRQSYLTQRKFEGLVLNGDLVQIGNYQDAFCESGDGDEISFSLSTNDQVKSYSWVFKRNVDKNFLPIKTPVDEQQFQHLNFFGKNFQYIAAEHLAAKEAHERNTFYVEQLNQLSEKNGDGKYTIHYFSHYSKTDIKFEKLKHPTTKSLNLKTQIEAWLNEISPNVRISVKEDSVGNSLTLKYQYDTADLGPTKEYKPENVGFGVSYILPVLVAILTAEKDSLLLIENPEAHLHPSGQSAIGKLLCLAAECGIQCIVETHSDHIINAVLVNVKEKQKETTQGISKDNVSIYFFDRDKESHTSKIYPIEIRDDARIINTPDNFFDQFRKDMKVIMGF